MQQAPRLSLSSRALCDADLPLIAAWLQSPLQLQGLFPQAAWPFTAADLADCLRMHRHVTVLQSEGEAVALVSLARAELYGSCRLGAVLVREDKRGLGLGRYLVELMREQARTRYHARDMRAVCHHADADSLLFFTRLGFEPAQVEARDGLAPAQVFIHLYQPLIPLAKTRP